MTRPRPATVAACQLAAKKLCHLSMRYVGAMLEAVTGKPVGMLPHKHPGLHETRDLINLIMLCRAELNAIGKVLIEQNVVSHERLTQLFTEEYKWFAGQKAEMLGVEVTDVGLNIDLDKIRKKREEMN